MSAIPPKTALESLDRDELLVTVRRLLVEADSLSSRISAVNEIGIAMNRTLDLTTIQHVIAKQAKWLLDFTHMNVCLKDKTGWRVITLFGPSEPQPADLIQCENIAPVLVNGQPRLISDGSPSPFLANYRSQLLITLSADNAVLGAINFAAVEPNSYSQDDMRIAYMLSLQLSSAIRNANIFAELQQTQETLKTLVEELDAYGHTIAHDLKTPLSNVLLWSELFKKMYGTRIPPESVRYIDTIHDSGRLMNRMIDQLLSLAKLRHTPQNRVPVDAGRAVDAAVLRFSHQLDARQIAMRVAPNMPAALGYEQWIEEIFANLISNAIKYMGEDNTNPRIEVTGTLQGDQVRYEVRDTGVGIKPEDQQRMFEKFTRLHNAKAEGLGLGLSIVFRMVKKMEGSIGVESSVGEGSTFWFTLPAVMQPPQTESKTEPPLSSASVKPDTITKAEAPPPAR